MSIYQKLFLLCVDGGGIRGCWFRSARSKPPISIRRRSSCNCRIRSNGWMILKRGESQAVLAGNPEMPGLYVQLVKWHAHHMSHPHFHPNDRFIYVISGTWWVGTGTKFDPDSTVPVPPGSFVKHFGKQVHYDGAKDEDTVLEIVGEGPATSTPAEVK